MTKMILGLSSYTYGWSIGVPGSMPADPMREDDLVEKTLSFDLSCLQIGDNLPLHQLGEERLHALKSRVKQEGLRLEIGARKLTTENLQQYLEIAEFFNAPLLRFIIDDAGYEPNISTVVAIIKNHLNTLKQKKVKLGIENHDRFKAKELASIMESVGDEAVGVCLDCVNSLGAGEGLEYVAHTLAPYTINLHIKDYQIERLSHKMGFIVQGCTAGNGMMDIPGLLQVLAPYKRCESAILEQWVVPESTIGETILKENQWAIQGIHYLKSQMLFETNIKK
ncbi:MAG: TIM barrel protein [Cyclobacteriaceae bacterium]